MLKPEENSGKPAKLAAFHNVVSIKNITEGIDKYRERAFGRIPAKGRRVVGGENGDSGKINTTIPAAIIINERRVTLLMPLT